MFKHLNNNKGLTLLELLVSIAILGFVIAGFLNLFVYGNTYILMSRQKSNTSFTAQTLANETMLNRSAADNTTTTPIELALILTPGAAITTESVILIEVTPPDEGKQSSTIYSIFPYKVE